MTDEEIALDERVREKIFSGMTYRDRLVARLVCHQWNDEICTVFSFNVILNDESNEFGSILKLPIYSLTVDSLKKEVWNLRRLRFPSLLTVLIITGPISLSNFEGFLQEAGQHRLQNLRKLVLYTDQVELIPSTPIPEIGQLRVKNISTNFGFGIPFPSVQSICVRRPIPSGSAFIETVPHRIFDLFLLSRFNNLKEFELINWDNPPEEKGYEQKCALRLFRFLSRHNTTLRSVGVKVTENLNKTAWSRTLSSPERTLHPDLRSDTLSNTYLEHVQVKRLLLALPATSPDEKRWTEVLYNQQRLKSLSCHFHDCPLLFYKPILIRNCHTLKELVLSNITCAETFDPGSFPTTNLAPFHFCTALEVLSISRCAKDSACSRQEPQLTSLLGTYPDMTNTRNLPSSLTTLHISGFQLLSHEIYTIAGILTNLVRLELEDVGWSGHFGVTGKCLRELLANLSELTYVRIRGLNTEIDVDEAVSVIRAIEKCYVKRSLSISAVQVKPATHTLEWEFNDSLPNPFALGRTIK